MSSETEHVESVHEVRERLTSLGGRIAYEFGFSRVAGQVLAALYLALGDRSLDDLMGELGLSKAAVSIAARQLEQIGLVQRMWRQNDRRSYYRTVDNLGVALQRGVRTLMGRCLAEVGSEVASALDELPAQGGSGQDSVEALRSRLERADVLRRRAERVLNSPLLKLVAR